MQGWGGPFRSEVGHVGVGWGHVGVGLVMQGWGGVGNVGVQLGGWVMQGWGWVM